MEKKFSTVKAIVDCYNMSEDDKLKLIQSYLLGWTSDHDALRVVKANNRLTAEQVIEYEKAHGSRAAANLLLLAGPDGYAGWDDYDTLLEKLEARAEKEALQHDTH